MNSKGVEVNPHHCESFQADIFVFAGDMIQSVELGFEFISAPYNFLCIMSGYSDDTADTLGNAGLFGDHKVLDVTGLGNMAENRLVIYVQKAASILTFHHKTPHWCCATSDCQYPWRFLRRRILE